VSVPDFEDYLTSLSAVAPEATAAEPEALDLCVRATAFVVALDPLDREGLSGAVATDPHIVPVFAAAAGLSQERFKTWLQTRFGTAGWVTLGRSRAAELVAAMDDDFGLLTLLTEQAQREWTWADVLARVMAPRQRAGSAIQQGRDLEDEVEAVITGIELDFVPRTRFEGSAGQSAPADFAIPAGGGDALIAVAVKGFDSTGSKLTDARREIEEMAKVRLPTQFIFAVVDGQGWIRRQNDLRSIHRLWAEKRIDGLYNRASLGSFEGSLRDAARRLDLI
jgi:hypothetical protein